ncbi:Fcf2 pre-rRNA processing-domain-containing protein [Kalaharituber pfeilii]|nr:Fcf2 pre-rRNA processing-domain-containing protein [Kalaharituber pfeilii]
MALAALQPANQLRAGAPGTNTAALPAGRSGDSSSSLTRLKNDSQQDMTMQDQEDEDDGDLSDDVVAQLLKEAEERLRLKAAGGASLQTSSSASASSSISTPASLPISFPKLDPGPLPKPYVISKGSISLTSVPAISAAEDRALARTIDDPVLVKKKPTVEDKEATAGAQWFDMPRTHMTEEVRRDIQLIQMRSVLDPKRHYKQNVLKEVPKYSQMGTLIEGNTEFFSARLTRRERKKTILEEILAAKETTDRFRRKRAEIDARTKVGKKEYYRKLKEKRKRA